MHHICFVLATFLEQPSQSDLSKKFSSQSSLLEPSPSRNPRRASTVAIFKGKCASKFFSGSSSSLKFSLLAASYTNAANLETSAVHTEPPQTGSDKAATSSNRPDVRLGFVSAACAMTEDLKHLVSLRDLWLHRLENLYSVEDWVPLLAAHGAQKAEEDEDMLWKVFHEHSNASVLVLYPITGGTENRLKPLAAFRKPVLIVADAARNSLPAALELQQYFRERMIPVQVAKTIEEAQEALQTLTARKPVVDQFLELRLGLIGEISPWLVNEQGIPLPHVKVDGNELLREFEKTSDKDGWDAVKELGPTQINTSEVNQSELTKAGRLYVALSRIVGRYNLDGFAIGCFDLIKAMDTTACLAMAMLNNQGITATCEGEMSSLVGMAVVQRMLGAKPFMANVADYDVAGQTLLLAHCTAPLLPGHAFELRSHFESNKGVAVALQLHQGEATLFKMRGRDVVLSKVEVVRCEAREACCRTQVVVSMREPKLFLSHSLGNHHHLIYHDARQVAQLFTDLGFRVMVHDA